MVQRRIILFHLDLLQIGCAIIPAMTYTTETSIEFPNRRLAKYALADAMMVAQAVQIAPILSLPGLDLPADPTTTDLEKAIKKRTRSFCAKASVIALDYLTRKYPDLFTHMLLLQTYNDKDHPFRRGYKRDKFSSWLVVRDKDGFWHGASPANHDPAKKSIDSPLTKEATPSQNLQDVLDEIAARDGGIWPTASEVLKVTEESITYRSPKSRRGKTKKTVMLNKLSVLSVVRKDGKVTSQYRPIQTVDPDAFVTTYVHLGQKLRETFAQLEATVEKRRAAISTVTAKPPESPSPDA